MSRVFIACIFIIQIVIFTDGLAAQLYIEKNILNRIGRIRTIVNSNS